jgi:anti-anti-sigma factor
VSPERDVSGSSSDEWPRGAAGRGPSAPNLSVVVGRGLGTVVVTVTGDLDLASCQLLGGVLTDLIDGQGNRTVAVDLKKTVVEPDALPVFITAARQARRRGTNFILKEPPAEAHQALQSEGYGDLIEVQPRRTGSA